MAQNGGDAEVKEEIELSPTEEAEAETLLNHGISKTVSKELLGIYKTGNQ